MRKMTQKKDETGCWMSSTGVGYKKISHFILMSTFEYEKEGNYKWSLEWSI